MSVITYPFPVLVDNSGNLLTSSATVFVSKVISSTGTVIWQAGSTSTNPATLIGTSPYVAVRYDAEANGEAFIVLSVSQSGSTVTGINASPTIYAAIDSSRVQNAINANGTLSQPVPLPSPVLGTTDLSNVAGSVLSTPTNKLSTDAQGRVTLTPSEHTLISGTDVPAALDAPGSLENNLTLRQALRLIASVLLGPASGANGGAATITFTSAGNGGITRVVATVDANGNRSNIILTP